MTPTATPTPVGSKPTATPKPGTTPTATPTKPTATPTATPTANANVFNDYTTFGYDNQRDSFNPNSTAFTDASLPNIHLAWQSGLSGNGSGDFNTQSQPILATEIAGHTGVLFTGGGSGYVYGYDALTGAQIWDTFTGQELYTCTGPGEGGGTAYFGVGGTAAYDPTSRSLYIVGNANASPNALGTNTLEHLDGATGAVLGSVAFASPSTQYPSLDFSHTSVTLQNGVAYVGTGATCDVSSWRGRVAAVSVPAMTNAGTYFTVWNPTTQPWGGGGVWGWGGVSIDASGDVLTGVGNTDNGSSSHGGISAPFTPAPSEYSGNGDGIIKLTPDLSTLVAVNHPVPVATFNGGAVDLDLNGTPVIYKPTGVCDPQVAIQGKAGALEIYDETNFAAPIATFQLAPSSYADGFLGNPGYSPVTGLLYVAVPSSNGSLYPAGMMAVSPGCGSPSVVWHAAFGPDSYAPGNDYVPGVPRSVPAASAGGVVFVGTQCVVTGGTCAATTTTNVRRAAGAPTKPLICCAPEGTEGGALWALDALTGTVLNGGLPVIVTGGPIRVPPTIDGEWLYVLDNNGDLYGLTLDPKYPAIQTRFRHQTRRRQTLAVPPKPQV